MATKTVVCPECHSPAAPGRYACAECGALLASVAVAARIRRRGRPVASGADGRPSAPIDGNGAGEPSVTGADVVTTRQVASPAWTKSLAAEPVVSEPADDERWDDEPAPDPSTVAAAEAELPAVQEPGPGFVPQAALEPAAAALEPALAEPEPAGIGQAAIADDDTGAADPPELAALAPLAAPPSWAVAAEPRDAAPVRHAVPAWPPEGDRGPLAEPIRRVPAGAYLPPSAVLPPGEALPLASAAGREADPIASSGPAEANRISSAARLEQLGLAADTPRTVVAIGAVIAGLGFLLPWAAVLAGSGLLGDYWTQWGLAGPGHWIVVVLLAALAALSLVRGRLEAWPVGLPAIAMATLLLGLTWPYLFGFLGRAVGIWVVLGGAILLVAGGLLDMRSDRHAGPDATV